MTVEDVYIGADHYVNYESARDSATGTYLNSGTCTFQLYTAAGVAVSGGDGTCSYVAASDGNYRGTVESTVTADLTLGARYYVLITFVQGAYNDLVRIDLRAAHRRPA